MVQDGYKSSPKSIGMPMVQEVTKGVPVHRHCPWSRKLQKESKSTGMPVVQDSYNNMPRELRY